MISITVDAKRAMRDLDALAQRQIPFARTLALNTVGFNVMRAERAAMPSIFEHPRPFTINSTLLTKASKPLPQVVVFIRPEAAKYLSPYETGGMHVLPAAVSMIPVDAKVDKFGQLPEGALARIAARPDVFVGIVDGIRGFWQRVPVMSAQQQRQHRRRLRKMGMSDAAIAANVPNRIRLLIRFGAPVAVQPKLHFESRAQDVIARTWPKAFEDAMARALATARP